MDENIYSTQYRSLIHKYETNFAFILNSQCYIYMFFCDLSKLEESRQLRKTKTANL